MPGVRLSLRVTGGFRRMIHTFHLRVHQFREQALHHDEQPSGPWRHYRSGIAFDTTGDRLGALLGRDAEPAAALYRRRRFSSKHVALKPGTHVSRADRHGVDAVASELHAETIG